MRVIVKDTVYQAVEEFYVAALENHPTLDIQTVLNKEERLYIMRCGLWAARIICVMSLVMFWIGSAKVIWTLSMRIFILRLG